MYAISITMASGAKHLISLSPKQIFKVPTETWGGFGSPLDSNVFLVSDVNVARIAMNVICMQLKTADIHIEDLANARRI